MDNRVAFVAGVVDLTDYVNVYGLVNPGPISATWLFRPTRLSRHPTRDLGRQYG